MKNKRIESPKRTVTIETDDGEVLTFVVDSCWKNEKLYSFCPSCAKPFYSINDKLILRARKYQPYLNKCNICESYKGYDFVVFERT